jgi:hypothetical protein
MWNQSFRNFLANSVFDLLSPAFAGNRIWKKIEHFLAGDGEIAVSNIYLVQGHEIAFAKPAVGG